MQYKYNTTRLNKHMAILFWYLVKSDLSSVGYCVRVHRTSEVLQGTRKTRPLYNCHPVNKPFLTKNCFLRNITFDSFMIILDFFLLFFLYPGGQKGTKRFIFIRIRFRSVNYGSGFGSRQYKPFFFFIKYISLHIIFSDFKRKFCFSFIFYYLSSI